MPGTTWNWDTARTGIGWPIAVVIGILAVIFWVQGSISKEWAMAILAVCAVRL